jgi:hypothetical protein
MIHQPVSPPAQAAGDLIDKALPFLSVLTMAMTVPQVWTIWVEHNVGGVSALSWGAYLLASCVWLVHGLRRHDPKMWVACIGWVALDAAVVAGVLVYR